jgi:hypothetical protein
MMSAGPSHLKRSLRQMSSVLGAIAFVGLPAALAAEPETGPGTARAINPHWRPDGCASCHVIKQGEISPVSVKQADATCLGCHDGRRASAEPHPIGCVLKGSELIKAPDWPLDQGRLVCLTCHDVLLGCDRSVSRSQTNPSFLRGPEVHDVSAFCATCHTQAPFKRLNPHRSLTPDLQMRGESCLFCHTQLLDRNTKVRTGKADLRMAEPDLCRSCHIAGHVDYFEPGHTGTKIPPKMLAYMAACEIAGPTSRPDRELISRLRSTGARPTQMLPDAEGRIVCTTCHNPHQKGVFPPDSVINYGAMQVVGQDHMISPVRGQQICLRCHDL